MSRHIRALLLLAAVACGYGYVAARDDRLSPVQAHAVTAAMKHDQGSLMRSDPVFGDSGLWHMNLPLPQALLRASLPLRASHGPTWPFAAAAGVLTMIYLCGMYLLLLRSCRSWSVAAFVAVLSSRIAYTLGCAHWGVGSLGSATPEGLFIACVPWVILAILRARSIRHLVLVFLAIGLLGNVYTTGAMNLTAVLLVMFLVRRWRPGRRWRMAGTCLVCVAAGASPAIWRHVSLRLALSAGAGAVDAAVAFDAFRLGGLQVLFYEVLRSLLDWLPIVAVLAIPSAALLFRAERFRARHMSFWLWFTGAAVVVALGLHALSMLAGVALKTPPPAIGFIQASSLVMVGLYVFFAAALTRLFRIVGSTRRILQLLCAVLLVAWLIPSDNLRPLRHGLQETAARLTGDVDGPRNVQRHREQARARAELARIAVWARDNTDPAAVFLTDRVEFRMLSGRAIAGAGDDVRYVYYLAPARLDQWRRLVADQRAAVAGGASADDVREFVARYQAEGLFEGVEHWYVVVHAGDDVGQGMEKVDGPGPGEAYELLRLP